MIRLGANYTAIRPIEKNTARSAHTPLKNSAAVLGNRLKITTNVAGMLGSSEAPAKIRPFVFIGGNVLKG
jgi:hypothetical protein